MTQPFRKPKETEHFRYATFQNPLKGQWHVVTNVNQNNPWCRVKTSACDAHHRAREHLCPLWGCSSSLWERQWEQGSHFSIGIIQGRWLAPWSALHPNNIPRMQTGKVWEYAQTPRLTITRALLILAVLYSIQKGISSNTTRKCSSNPGWEGLTGTAIRQLSVSASNGSSQPRQEREMWDKTSQVLFHTWRARSQAEHADLWQMSSSLEERLPASCAGLRSGLEAASWRKTFLVWNAGLQTPNSVPHAWLLWLHLDI